jgi:hypothetical protein
MVWGIYYSFVFLGLSVLRYHHVELALHHKVCSLGIDNFYYYICVIYFRLVQILNIHKYLYLNAMEYIAAIVANTIPLHDVLLTVLFHYLFRILLLHLLNYLRYPLMLQSVLEISKFHWIKNT